MKCGLEMVKKANSSAVRSEMFCPKEYHAIRGWYVCAQCRKRVCSVFQGLIYCGTKSDREEFQALITFARGETRGKGVRS